MPSLQSWQQAVAAADLYSNSSVVMLRNRHYPPGGTSTTNFANSSKGMAEMTMAVERWLPVPKQTDVYGQFLCVVSHDANISGRFLQFADPALPTGKWKA